MILGITHLHFTSSVMRQGELNIRERIFTLMYVFILSQNPEDYFLAVWSGGDFGPREERIEEYSMILKSLCDGKYDSKFNQRLFSTSHTNYDTYDRYISVISLILAHRLCNLLRMISDVHVHKRSHRQKQTER